MRVLANWFEPPRQISSRFPVGSQIVIRYDPSKPSTSTIRAGLAYYDVLLALVGVVVLASIVLASGWELRKRFGSATDHNRHL
uniref:DUF3592 domain-containing protein n=1 Tax=uncultured Planctomycetales bacterium HF0500_02G17 TaxID=723608 RepID=E7C4L5_9BACT|nr:hypothetical protein [uncultured Planctomycetales bacterium HF0500_02G17]